MAESSAYRVKGSVLIYHTSEHFSPEAHLRERVPILLEDGLVRRTVVVLGDDLMRLVRIEELQIGFGRGSRALAVGIRIHDGNVRLGAHTEGQRTMRQALLPVLGD